MKDRPVATSLLLFLAALVFAVSASADQAPQLIASYKIDAQLQLDEKRHPTKLTGREQLTWLNASPDTISELQFHLYLNAFKNQKSTFFRESGGQLRDDKYAAGEWGWIDVNEMKIVGSEDLTGRLEFIHPDDDNADDQTVLRAPLSKPIKPGQQIVLEIKFTARLPQVFARTGFWGEFALVGQWFPKIAVWEEAGERRRAVAGWNCHQFHASSEFYADYGNYDVTLTVPALYRGKVGATGKLQAEKVNPDGTITYNFTQANVHDFAWTLDPKYVVLNRTFKAAEWVRQSELDELAQTLRLPAEALRLKDVECALLLQPEHVYQADRHFNAAFNAIKYYGLWYGAYPYDTLTVVDPPLNGDGASGMEYPTFITAGTSWWLSQQQDPETVIVHEFGHQFWYGLLASNEFEEAWLDEGFNTYSECKVMGKAYGDNMLALKAHGVPLTYLPVKLPHPLENRLGTFMEPFNDPILQLAWKYYDFNSYGLNSYARTGLTLTTLERYLGEEVMARVMREYASKWRYRHPTSQDFFETANQVAGQDLSWFFEQFVRGVQTLDYELASFESKSVENKLGVYDKDGKKTEVSQSKDASPPSLYENEVVVRRAGEAWFPVELLATLKDGKTIAFKPVAVRAGAVEYQATNNQDGRQWTEEWPLKDRWKRFKFTSAAELKLAQLDPATKVLLDANLSNNSRTTATGVRAAARWTAGAGFWIQTILQALASLS